MVTHWENLVDRLIIYYNNLTKQEAACEKVENACYSHHSKLITGDDHGKTAYVQITLETIFRIVFQVSATKENLDRFFQLHHRFSI